MREQSHDLCDAAATRQLAPETLEAVTEWVGRYGRRVGPLDAVTVSENVAGTSRVLHLDARESVRWQAGPDEPLPGGLTGVTSARGTRLFLHQGSQPHVIEQARTLCGDAAPVPADVTWVRSAVSFFQGNRFLTGALLGEVLGAVQGERVADLYAGVGLFAVACAATGRRVHAVEGDPFSGTDLVANAAPWADRLAVDAASVEAVVADLPVAAFDTVILDPPRTGASTEALAGIIALGAARVVYVSCDPATLGRDVRVLRDAGYALSRIAAFDLFPNTAHVETVAVFDRA